MPTSGAPATSPTITAAPDSGSYHGRWITFEWQRSTCTVSNYTIEGNVIFREVRGTGACDLEEQAGETAGVRLFNANGSLRLHDTPNGLLRFHVFHEAISFRLGPDVTISGEARERDLEVRGARIHILPTSPLGTIAWDAGGFVAREIDGNVMLRPVNPQPTMEAPGAVNQAVHEGRVAGEVTIDQATAQGRTPPTIVPYEDVTIAVSRPNQTAFRLTVEADLDEGQTIVSHFGRGVLRHEDITVVYHVEDEDGVIGPGEIRSATDLDDVLDPRPGEGTEYWVVEDAQGVHVLFSVPHWSIHVFDVLGMPPQYVPVLVYGVVLSGLFVGMAAVGAFLSRRSA